MEIEQTMEGDVLLKTERCPSATTHRGGLDGISALIQADEIGKEQRRRENGSRT